MIISIWRYSHMLLAVFSFLFLTVLSATGIILAFEPITEKVKGYKAENFDQFKVANVVPLLKEKYQGIQEISVDDYDHVTISYIDKKGNTVKAYVNPSTGEIIGTPAEKSELFQWATTLHRSLFLHEAGRLIVGITSFLLVLIVLSGIALVIQRQKGLKRFFAPVEKTTGAQYYHVVFGRIVLLFILAISLTGTYLSVSRFEFFADKQAKPEVDIDNMKEDPQIKFAEFPVFHSTPLSSLKLLQYPFSDFPEDYFTLKLKEGEITVNQFTGEVLTQVKYPTSQELSDFSLRWHTGRSNIVWAVILAIASGYILFFIYSGLLIMIRRLSNRSKNKFTANESRIIILVGSENGTSFKFAKTVYRQLIQHGEKVFLTDLNNYTVFESAEHLVVMTATYGLGDPPSNAKQFVHKLQKFSQHRSVKFSVLAFGSRSYPEFCKFGSDVDSMLRHQDWAAPLMDLVTVNERSPQDFSDWLTEWSKRSGFPLTLSRELLKTNQKDLQSYTVSTRSEKDENGSFIIRLRPRLTRRVVSGDLLAVYPKNDHRERLYSVGKVGRDLQLAVKWYDKGLGSHYLYELQAGSKINAKFIKNQHFHFPRKTPVVIMISNGTGIAPFLGMIDENKRKVPILLYCGFKTASSFDIYRDYLGKYIAEERLKAFHLALSREGVRQYVSQLILNDREFFVQSLLSGGVIMICGSLSMEKDVMTVLKEICDLQKLNLQTFIDAKQILTDCY